MALPDALLLEAARRGDLHDPAVLNRQVVRMLRDPKSVSLVDNFFAPWLSLDKLKTAQPDPSLYPQVDAELLQAMDTETRLFLQSQLREDRDAVELWTANYTYVNERLAPSLSPTALRPASAARNSGVSPGRTRIAPVFSVRPAR